MFPMAYKQFVQGSFGISHRVQRRYADSGRCRSLQLEYIEIQSRDGYSGERDARGSGVLRSECPREGAASSRGSWRTTDVWDAVDQWR
nr:hypothetical protein CFP56_68804 [Quercus suber]